MTQAWLMKCGSTRTVGRSTDCDIQVSGRGGEGRGRASSQATSFPLLMRYSLTYIHHPLYSIVLSSPSAGIRDESGALISWALCRDGTVGNVFTLSNHQRKGFSSIVVRSLVKNMADRGIHAICDIVVGNDASEALFTKFNFTRLEQSHWTYMFNGSFEVKDFNELRDRCDEVLCKYEWRFPLDDEWERVYDMVRRGYTMNAVVVDGVEKLPVASLEDLRSRDVMLLCPKGFQGYLGCYIGAMEVVILAAGSRKKGFEHLMSLHYERYAS
jgi:hypothetical protein